MASIHFNTSSRTDQSSRKYPEDHTNNNRRNSVYHCQGLVLDSKSAEHLEEEECKLPDEEDAHLSEEERPSFALPNDNDDNNHDEYERPSLALANENASNDDDEEEEVLGSPIGLPPVPCPAVCVHDESFEGEEQQSTISNERNHEEERIFSV